MTNTSSSAQDKPLDGWRLKLYTIIFEADTVAGRRFDQAVLIAILVSVAVVVLDSVQSLQTRWGGIFTAIEWFFTLAFTAEYVLRLICLRRPLSYALSFFGIIDLLSVLPTYLAILVPEAHLLIDVRILRLLRVFRIFKLTGFVNEYTSLGRAIQASRRKILVFLSFVLMVVLVLGTVMHVIEGPEHGFTSIPTSMYWAVTTMTTVGFGDITPKTDLGRLVSSLMMLLGWGVLAVPTGIVTAEMTAQRQQGGNGGGATSPSTTRTCPNCLTEGLSHEANYCWKCGTELPAHQHDAT
ncbi:MAG TPA: ion transporter [Aquabacterium sp.]|uniref:ion transporter n=1 Tax=Aquabacterium sp. TaxID=1872578 RepID=UPI002E37DE60|nr:ion transporter [Aquabacterium sp.]HEX5371990.1 ion transporter [Aquabacterium sp.]